MKNRFPSPLSQWPTSRRAAIKGVFCDIDDTLTRHGRIGSDVFAAMEQLRAAKLLVVPITGRPAGWCDLIARQWPVDGVIGENGAMYFRYDDKTRIMTRHYHTPDKERTANRQKLNAIAEEVLATIPGAKISADQAYREADLAIDFAEDTGPLDRSAIDAIVAIFAKHKATAKVSSIHVNGWYGEYDKLSQTKTFMSDIFNVDLDHNRHEYAFVGDSPNDSPMFGFFPDSVGVANLAAMIDQCPQIPAYIADGGSGDGFIEVAQAKKKKKK